MDEVVAQRDGEGSRGPAGLGRRADAAGTASARRRRRPRPPPPPAATDATRLRPAAGGPHARAADRREERSRRDPPRHGRRGGAGAAPTSGDERGAAASAPADARGVHASRPAAPPERRPRRRAHPRRRSQRRYVPVLVLAAVLALVAGLLLGELERLRHGLHRLGVCGLHRALLPVQLAAARERPRGPGTHLLTAAGAEHRLSRGRLRRLLERSPASACSQARWAPLGPRCCPPRSSQPSTERCPAPEPVRLGAYQAYRYSGLSVHGLAAPLTLYTVPTTGGVVTIACLGSAAAARGRNARRSPPR